MTQPMVRTFRAPDSASALLAVKTALGPEAVILSTRTFAGGLFRRHEVEITAAVEPSIPHRIGPPRDEDFPLPPRTLSVRPMDDPMKDEVRLLRQSVEEARRALASVTREARAGRDLQLPPAGAEIHARLVGRGVEPALSEALVRSALEVSNPEPSRVLAAVKDLLGERLVPCRAPWLLDGRHVIALVGPTGVGKTTTVAKLAARALLETKRRVALVTLDTYRIAATEQLARYAEIMNVPVLVARDKAELARALERLHDADFVLVDTAGRSSLEDVQRQAAIVRTVPRLQMHLVVSAATGANELAAVADRYRELSPDRLIVTKIDESAGPGGILSASARIQRPISCVADGQRVPEDLHALTGIQLVDLVAGAEPA